MSHARSQHPNAPLTPEGRARMVDCVLTGGWTIEATAERFQIDLPGQVHVDQSDPQTGGHGGGWNRIAAVGGDNDLSPTGGRRELRKCDAKGFAPRAVQREPLRR